MEKIQMFAPLTSYEEYDLNKKIIDKVALIDADRYKHVVTYRIWEKLINEGIQHTKTLVNEIIDDYLSMDIFNRFDAKAYVFCFSAPTKKVFRSYIAQEKEYKGSRKKREDPHFYNQKFDDMAYVFEYMNSRYQTLYFDDIEADDLLSILQREETFIFSHDGDLKQVSGTHWDLKRYEFYEISKKDAFRTLMYQILKGASKDSIIGLHGFGEKALYDFKHNIETNDLCEEAIVSSAIKLFVNKHGIDGFDTFVEMWTLAATRKDRGSYTKEKYATAFHIINNLCKTNEDKNAEHDVDVKDI